ncbi:MAG: DUF4383 domain-containing protein [Oculatellaceae cyanobacterium Prado106]|nr:DUF4383 domain-containing protein [Oculatellaceae cyanobacterium Prado106]
MQSKYTPSLQNIGGAERTFALVTGLIFLIVGIAGFMPSLTSFPMAAPTTFTDAPNLVSDYGYGHVFGLFPTNFLHNAVHIVVGLLGLAAATSYGGSLYFNRAFAISYAPIAIMGLIPGLNTFFGLMPLYGNNVWFNALMGILAAYFGFVKPVEAANA